MSVPGKEPNNHIMCPSEGLHKIVDTLSNSLFMLVGKQAIETVSVRFRAGDRRTDSCLVLLTNFDFWSVDGLSEIDFGPT